MLDGNTLLSLWIHLHVCAFPEFFSPFDINIYLPSQSLPQAHITEKSICGEIHLSENPPKTPQIVVFKLW